jgi:hypothetical protein
MKRGFLMLGAIALAIALSAGTAAAQVVGTGTVEITVLDSSGSAIPGVLITVEAVDSTTKRTAVTDDSGRAVIPALQPSERYVVTSSITGFTTNRYENVLVRSGQVTQLSVTLTVGGVTEQVQVRAETPLVDTTTATRGQDITLQLTESLPTGRSYQSYLQLVPGVMPDDPERPGNPASKSGVNYSDIGGNVGQSTDNFYYFNGINVTDGQTGTFGANLNTEIIQEQKVLTGAIPAEYVGAAGLLTNVITKSGSNTFHGSANYFFQNDGLVNRNKNSEDQVFSTFDTAFTIGGPVIRDKAWFYGSYRRLERDDDVTALDTGQFLRSVNNAQDQGYAKGTYQPTLNDTISLTFLNDPTEISGRRERDITNAQDRSRVQGGNRWGLSYQRLAGTALFDVAYTQHDGEVTDLAVIREASNTIKYRSTDVRTLTDEQRGGFGSDNEDIRSTKGVNASVQYLWNDHTFKTGLEFQRYGRFLNATTVEDAVYTSIASHLSGVSAAEIATGSFSQSLRFDPTNVSDYNGFITTVDGLPNRNQFYAAFDTNADGTISPDELGASLFYDSTAGNPNGQVNYFRIAQVQDGAQDFKADGLSFYVQDTWRLDRFTLNLGVRTEQWKHFASEGTKIFTFEWAWAPRLSAIYDLTGDGRQKLFAYYGRYYDPIRTNMTAFAGSISGRIREEQVFALGEWVNYRTRGGPVSQDAFIAPTTKTPYTDDVELGYEVDLGRNMSAEITYTHRATRDILEDYDHNLYALARYPGPTDHPDALYLPPSYFGYDTFPAANFFIATLAGGKRDYDGVEFVLRKRYSDNWQGLLSYTFNDASGNTNSDSNADFQGDVIWLDPRAPNQYGPQPGSIRHLFKMGGSYDFDFGLQLGFGYRWNSGTLASRTFASSGRNLPYRVSVPFEFAGITERWLADDAVGSLTNPSWGTVDVRAQYIFNVQQARIEAFLDIFNLTNSQDASRLQDVLAGVGGTAFQEGIRFLDPRRFFIGFRVGF